MRNRLHLQKGIQQMSLVPAFEGGGGRNTTLTDNKVDSKPIVNHFAQHPTGLENCDRYGCQYD